MTKTNEIEYINNIGHEGKMHAFNKPFSDGDCGQLLADIGYIFSLLPPPPAKLLDLGIGTGWTSAFFSKRGYDVVGQDISIDMIDLAELNKKAYQCETLNFITSDFEEMTFKNQFDCAIFYQSLHHSVDEKKAIVSVYNALKPGGIFLSIEPGVGHSKTESSLIAMKKYGVTEKDMPPSRIIKAGKLAGFKKFKIFFRFAEPFEILPHLSRRGFIYVCKSILRFLPGIGNKKCNVVMMIK
jgi:ubiquinone/menaquinone biosynthesis C-methylase UbiE